MPKQLLLPLTFDALPSAPSSSEENSDGRLVNKVLLCIPCLIQGIQGSLQRYSIIEPFIWRETVPNFNFPHIKVALALLQKLNF